LQRTSPISQYIFSKKGSFLHGSLAETPRYSAAISFFSGFILKRHLIAEEKQNNAS
tara:strand:+ start:1424 stop:1591 length:168 start_codon:yes stop_codon:yes gene_type:complete